MDIEPHRRRLSKFVVVVGVLVCGKKRVIEPNKHFNYSLLNKLLS